MHRWPSILTQVVDGLFRECHQLSQAGTAVDKAQEGKAIIEKISAIKYELTHNRPLKPLHVPFTPKQGPYTFCSASSEPYDSVIEQTKPTWFDSDSLFAECYLYRSLKHIFETSSQWKDYDPFMSSKMEALCASGRAIYACAAWMEELLQKSPTFSATASDTKEIFDTLVSLPLCGNETDPDFDLKQRKCSNRIVADDSTSLWKKVQTLQNDRVDIVLGNTGFELVAGLLLAEFLLALRGPIPFASQERADELQMRIQSVRSRVANATKAAHANSEPRLLAVSKLHPPSDLMAVYERTGQRHFGENYVQELVEKAAVLPDDIQWHFIGGLQSNKAKVLATVPNLYAVQSLDSEKLATGLEKALSKAENLSRRTEPLYVYVQVNTSGEEGKSGVPSMNSSWSMGEKPLLLQLAQKIILGCPHLRLRGLMTIGALANSRAAGNTHENPDFERLSQSRKYLMDALQLDSAFQADLRKARWWTPAGEVSDAYALESETEFGLSMGMSADMEAAVALGSTEVRIGSDCFGKRSSNNEAGKVRTAEINAYSERPLVREVVFHTKNMPWFVNVCINFLTFQEACAKDVFIALKKLSEDGFFPSEQGPSSLTPVHEMARRWKSLFEQGRFRLQDSRELPLGTTTDALDEFWTWPDSYGAMPQRAPSLFAELQKAGLVLFLGTFSKKNY